MVVRLHASFEELVQRDGDWGGEYWLARDLQTLLGYAKWENFVKVIEKAKTACQASGYEPADHFLDVRKIVELGSGANREIEDIALTRYACYLIAQTYFAVQTRKQELIEQRLAEVERLSARKKLTTSEKELSGIIYERVGDQMSFARIRSSGDMALFGVQIEHLVITQVIDGLCAVASASASLRNSTR